MSEKSWACPVQINNFNHRFWSSEIDRISVKYVSPSEQQFIMETYEIKRLNTVLKKRIIAPINLIINLESWTDSGQIEWAD